MVRCVICHDSITDDRYVLVSFEGGIRPVCDLCVERADTGEELVEHLDMAREGLPEFNVAWSTW